MQYRERERVFTDCRLWLKRKWAFHHSSLECEGSILEDLIEITNNFFLHVGYCTGCSWLNILLFKQPLLEHATDNTF